MKKKFIYNPIVKVLQFIGLVLAVLITISIFCGLAEWSSEKNNTPRRSTSDNIELNDIEQYHLLEGRSIKFVEDIIGY